MKNEDVVGYALRLEYVGAINKKKNPNLARVPDGMVVTFICP